MSRLAPSIESGGGVVAIYDRALVWFDDRGQRREETKLDKRATHVARFGDEWLVRLEKQKQLARHNPDGAAGGGGGGLAFASGKSTIDCFGVGRDDAVVVTRGDSLELWSRDDKKKWAVKGTGPFLSALPVRDYVVALGDDGALYFFARDKGDALGALRLASVEPASEWRLAHVDANVVVLALGDWLVWIDASTRKTVRRVRARAKVLELAADASHVAVAVEDGFVQAFQSSTGEPRAAFSSAHDEGVAGIALGAGVLFTVGQDLDVRACDRQTLDVAVRVASPITVLAMRGGQTVACDRTGNARVFEAGDFTTVVATITAGEGVVGLHVAKNGMVITAGRMLMRSPRPYNVPVRPGLLKGTATAFVADDAYAFVGTSTGAVDVYELVSAGHVTSYALSSDDRVTALVRLASGPLLVVGTGALDGRLLIVDVADAKVIHRISPHEEAFGVTSLACDARGRIVASGSDDGSVALVDPTKGRVLARIRVSETPTSMAFEPSGRRLAVVFADGTASIVTLAQSGATVSDLGVRGASVVAWGDQLVFGFKDGHVESGDRHTRPSDRPGARPN